MSRPERRTRSADQWVTPAVVVCLILAGLVVILAVLGCVTYLTTRGFDPQPIVQLVGTLLAAAAASGNFMLSLIKRKHETKVERQVGRLATGVIRTVDQLEAERGRHAGPAEWAEETDEPASLTYQDSRPRQSTGGTGGRPAVPGGYSDTPVADLQDTAWFRQ